MTNLRRLDPTELKVSVLRLKTPTSIITLKEMESYIFEKVKVDLFQKSNHIFVKQRIY